MLTLQFIPYSDIEQLGSDDRVHKLLKLVKEEKIVLMQGRLHPEEETLLIQRTLSEVNDTFKGIELCTIYPEAKDLRLFGRMKKEMTKMLLGNRDGVTIIGPATIIKDIKKDPNKIMLFTTGSALGRPKRRSASRKTSSARKRRRR